VPSYDLAWRRFQADLTNEFIAEQAEIVRDVAREDQFVTTCMQLVRPAFAPEPLNRSLDVAAVNPYYAMQDGLALPPRDAGPRPWRSPWHRGDGPWSIYLQADMSYGARRAPFLVTETNAISIGDSHHNFPAYDGQWRQAAWALVARGARMVEYWHWHSIHFGQETYWLGVLDHSGEPGRCFAEVKRIAGELAHAGATVTELEPDLDVALLYSPESRWALEFQPPLDVDGAPDRHAYDRIVGDIYAGLFDAGAQVAVVYPEQLDALRHPVLVVPALYVADDPLLDALEAYARAGGHLVIGFRTGYADEEARARHEAMPGRLRAAAGVTYGEFTNLRRPVPVRATGDLELPDGAAATAWADGLVPEGAQVLARYEDPHLGRWAALTTRAHGDGCVTYLGTLPNRAFATALGRWLAPARAWPDRPETVTVTGARNRAGERLRFVSNWSWEPAALALPAEAQDVLSGKRLARGERLELGAWDVRVLLEEPREENNEEGSSS
jgi:beta-galactosidase